MRNTVTVDDELIAKAAELTVDTSVWIDHATADIEVEILVQPPG